MTIKDFVLFTDCIEIDPQRCGGQPVLKSTRFALAQVLTQIADGDSVEALVSNFGMNKDHLERILHGMAVCIDREFSKG